ncbi:alpha/beta fold hydrolase [Hephaestia sp. GCM10023244]|uniref:alpha/beta fold hydrolase n=1 Tax=unclassified Hephaestia TaxID=2631281 RepID=UPI0020773CED|nr:alpha/beta hydrolase [Hephaestia sp. MAHUQ-44]MCM8732507.1 alpha/beta hydrolase [Hephaestia sp. MAHUQ-44]
MDLSRRPLLAALDTMALTAASPVFARGGGFAPPPPMPPARYIETNGLRMAVYEAGAGPAIVLLHGFPELAHSWRRQIPALARAGYRVIAPDLRGYGLTDRPAAREDYDLAHLMDDLTGLLDALDVKKAIWMGHDWGGILAWQMALFHEKRTSGVISITTPFVPHWQYWLQPEQISGLAAKGFESDPDVDPLEQMRRIYSPDMYVLMMHDGDKADRLLSRDPARSFRSMVRKNVITPADYFALPAEYRHMAFFTPLGLPETPMLGEEILDAEDLAFFAARFEATGFTPAINWYRNLSRNWQAGLKVDQTVRVPSLMIAAEDDVAFTPGMAEGMSNHVPDLQTVMIRGSGHWVLYEKPDELNRVVLAWLERRFPR